MSEFNAIEETALLPPELRPPHMIGDQILDEVAVGYLLDAKPTEVLTLFTHGKIRGKRHWGGKWRSTYQAVLDYLESEVKP